jgi:ribonuclease HI
VYERELSGGEAMTTNNRMELTAVIRALEALNRPCEVVLYADGHYVRQGITEWIHNWKKRGWVTTDRKQVKNADVGRALDKEAARHEIQWQWIKGHSGDEGNERADALAHVGAARFA